MKDDALKKHKDCGGKVKRLISGGAGIIFKGSGFYETDYKRKSATKAKTPASSPSGTKDPSKSSDSKKESKSESKKKA